MRRETNRTAARAFLLVVGLSALVSLAVGVYDALGAGRSQDFQWSGAHMLLHHIDLGFLLELLVTVPTYQGTQMRLALGGHTNRIGRE